MLTPSEAALSSYDGNTAPLPHPFLSDTPAPPPAAQMAPLRPGKHTQEILGEFGIGDEECRRLVAEEAIGGLGGFPAFKL
jgi:alpha-methylacyl-CoA racemase